MRRALEQLLIGRALGGRYELQGVLGRGGMSVVYRAFDRTLGRPVALKVIQQPTGTDHLRSDLRRRFRREAGAAARISPHPHVVRIYDFGTDAELDLDFIVMELLEGSDLAALLQTNPPRRAEALCILLQAAQGIAAGHAAGILHRDIKPGNLFLVQPDHDVRVLDFGIAKLIEAEADEDITVLGLTPHSPAYASPEQLQTERPLTPASDVYQLGLVAYETLAGSKPYTPEERESLLRGETLPVPARGAWETVPDPVRRVIERALRLDPGERWPDASAFAVALATVAQELGDIPDTLVPVWPALDAGSVRAEEADEETRALEPPAGVPDETLFAPGETAGPPFAAFEADDVTLHAPEEGPTGGKPAAAPDGDARSAERQRIGRWFRGRRRGVAAVLLLFGAAAGTWGVYAFLEADGPRPDAPLLEMEAEFRPLQSEAARELERAGEWAPANR